MGCERAGRLVNVAGARRHGRPLRTRLGAIAAGAAVALSIAACDDGDPEPDAAVDIGAAAYSAALDAYLPPTAGPDDPLPVVHVWRLGDEPFPLDIQVAMIDAVAATHDLRFVDDRIAAVDGDQGGDPRDDGVLIGVGVIPALPPHTVRIEVYNDAERVDARLVTLEGRDDSWRVVATVPVDVEVLVGDG